jgi:hypothetical protein
MSLFLFRFWPVLIPLLVYCLWHWRCVARAKKQGVAPPRFRDGPWYWAVMASLALGLFSFLFIGLSHAPEKGQYVPPQMKDGNIIPGHVE